MVEFPSSTPSLVSHQIKTGEETRIALAHIVPVSAKNTIQGLGRSLLLNDVFRCAGAHVWYIRPGSKTLEHHFPEKKISPECLYDQQICPIVPLTVILGLYALRYNRQSIRCQIIKPTLPGNLMTLSERAASVAMTDGSQSETIQFIPYKPDDEKIGKGLKIPDEIVMNGISDFRLPQGDAFQFVTGVKTSLDNEWFSGIFRTGHTFDLAALAEVVAQMGAAVGSKTRLKKDEIYVYKGGVFNFDPDIALVPMESLRLSAQLLKVEGKRNVSFIFCLRRSSDNKEIFWGQVDALSMKYTTLVESCDREKVGRLIGVEN